MAGDRLISAGDPNNADARQASGTKVVRPSWHSFSAHREIRFYLLSSRLRPVRTERFEGRARNKERSPSAGAPQHGREAGLFARPPLGRRGRGRPFGSSRDGRRLALTGPAPQCPLSSQAPQSTKARSAFVPVLLSCRERLTQGGEGSWYSGLALRLAALEILRRSLRARPHSGRERRSGRRSFPRF